MKYSEIEDKYIRACIKGHYKFQDALQVKEVLGYDFRTIRGFKDLTTEQEKLAERLICNFLNMHGIEAREEIRFTSIKRDKGKFILKYIERARKTLSYLYDNGTVG